MIWVRPIVFLVMIGLAMTVLRWDVLVYPGVVNSDEDLFLACAMRFLEDPVPWRGADAGTSGPVNVYALVFPMLLGAPASYVTARVLALLLEWGTVICTFLALRVLASELSAMASVIPMAAFFGLTKHFDFVHYSSEHLPIFLLSLAVCLLVAYAESPRPRRVMMATAGLVLGAVPFAKLQAAPLAAALVVIWACVVVVRARAIHMSAARHLAILAAAVAILPAVILGAAYAGGAIEDFWVSYVSYNLIYSSQPLTLATAVSLLLGTSEMQVMVFWASSVFIVASLAVISWRAGHRRLALHVALTLGYLGLTMWVIAKPGKDFGHYYLFLVFPLTLLAGLVLGTADERMRTGRKGYTAWYRSAIVPLLAIGLLAGLKMAEQPRHVRYDQLNFSSALHRAVSEKVLEYARPGDSLAVWGWAPELHVHTGLVPATRDLVPIRAVEATPLAYYYRARLLRDLSKNLPSVLVDTTGSLLCGPDVAFWDRQASGLHRFPALHVLVRDRYERVFSVGSDPNKTYAVGQAVEIYVLKSRLAQRETGDLGATATDGLSRH